MTRLQCLVCRQPVSPVDEDVVTCGGKLRFAADQPPHDVVLPLHGECATKITPAPLHLVPRSPGDGLVLPWTGQRKDSE